MAIKIGPPVIGADFFGRKNEIDEAMEELIAGNHLSINAPRRIGKSSFVLKLKNILINEHNWRGVFFDMEGASDEIDFAKRLIEAIQSSGSKLKKSILEELKGIELSIGNWVSIKTPQNGVDVPDQILINLSNLINQIEGSFLIIVDELPIFLQHLIKQTDGESRVRRFLHLLRSFKINENQEEGHNIVWVFCGSVGLEYFVRRYRMAGGISELKPFELGAFSDSEAKEFLQYLSKKENYFLNETQINHIIQKTGWPTPFFLAILFEQTKLFCKGKPAATISDIDIAYINAIRKYSSKFETWYSRLAEQLNINESYIANQTLDIIAINKTGITFLDIHKELSNEHSSVTITKEELTDIIDLLIHDGYIAKQNNLYFFRSPLLRDWWIIRKNL